MFWLLKKNRPNWCHLLFCFTSYVLNMFRTLIYLSSGACDYSVELPHWSYCSWFDVCWSFGVVGLEWYRNHRNSNTHRTKNNTINVVIQQNNRKLLMMDILMSETCWAHKKWNKITSDIKLVFYSSTITMMHGPINIRFSLFLKLFSKSPSFLHSIVLICLCVDVHSLALSIQQVRSNGVRTVRTVGLWRLSDGEFQRWGN